MAAILLAAAVAAVPAAAQLSVTGFTADVLDKTGNPETQAGAHPFVAENVIDVEGDGTGFGVTGSLKEVVVDMPVGFVGDPSRLPTCTTPQLAALTCPRASQIGMFRMTTPFVVLTSGIFNMDVPKGQPARFGTPVLSGSALVYFDASVRPEDDGITVTSSDISHILPIAQTRVELWGVPADPAHDAERGGPSGVARVPFLTTQTDCSRQPVTRVRINSWQAPSHWEEREFQSPPLEGCDVLDFRPSLRVQPERRAAGVPSAYTIELEQELRDSADALASAHLDDMKVALPEGVAINSGAADGLETCTEDQFGLRKGTAPTCPDGSKIGDVTVETPVLDEPLTGAVYQAAQDANPFGSTFAIYMAPSSDRFGVRLKLAGKVTTDPVTGRVTTTFEDNPQQPFSKLTLTLKGGDRAMLVNPATCGAKATEWSASSWARPGETVDGVDVFEIDCRPGLDSFTPSFAAGSTNPVAGSFSPFVMRVARETGKELGRIDVVLPRGSLASLEHVDVCGEAQLAAATLDRPGRASQGAPSCPLGSQVGTTTIGVGAGPAPYFTALPGTDVSGRVFLTGAHTGTQFPVAGARQAAYGLAIEVPAVAGPFDLGTVLVRAAVYADANTAELRVVSDRLPRILDGVPLNVREVRVDVDRPGFTMNPSSCAEQRVLGDIRAQDDTVATRSSRFQVGDCAALPFGPRLGLRLTGRRQMRTGRHPGVRAVVRPGGVGDAAIRRAVVRLPKSLALDPDNANALCEFSEGTRPDLENHCPKGSVVGRARVRTPLLKRDLVGDVYFVKNVRVDRRTGNAIRTLPMIVVALRGEIAINLRGESSTARGGALVATFASVPDAPIDRFDLRVRGGKAGILAVTRTRRSAIDLCATPRGHIATNGMSGHNGKRADYRVRVKTPCGKRAAGKRAAKAESGGRGGSGR